MRVNPDPPVSAPPPVSTPVAQALEPRQRGPREGHHKGGRPGIPGTRLAKIMRERHIRQHQIGSILRVSDRAVYNYLARRRAIPALQLAALCDRLDVDPEEIVDRRRFLLPDEG